MGEPVIKLPNIDDDEVRVDEASELNGKALDAVMWLASSYESATISHEAFLIGIQAIFSVCSGFVLPETREVIEAASKSKKIGLDAPILMWMKAPKAVRIVQVIWRPGAEAVCTLAYKVQSGQTELPPEPLSQSKSFADEANPAAAARVFMAKTIKALLAKGYERMSP